MSALKEAFFADLVRHLGKWSGSLVENIRDPSRATKSSDVPEAFERLRSKNWSEDELQDLQAVIRETCQGLLHSTLVTIDGGTVMTETGRVALIDADSKELLTEGALHDEFFEYLAKVGLL